MRWGESGLSLTPDGSGRRGGEGQEGLGEKSSALKHTSELTLLGGWGQGGCPPDAFTGTLPACGLDLPALPATLPPPQ